MLAATYTLNSGAFILKKTPVGRISTPQAFYARFMPLLTRGAPRTTSRADGLITAQKNLWHPPNPRKEMPHRRETAAGTGGFRAKGRLGSPGPPEAPHSPSGDEQQAKKSQDGVEVSHEAWTA